MTPEIGVEVVDGVLTVTMSRPDKKNVLTNDMYGALADAVERADADGAIRAVLIQAEGDAFTAGNDVSEFTAQAMGNGPAERPVLRFLRALANATVPIVAAVQGKAVGIGTTMLLHCDYVLLADDAQLITPFVNLALVPEAASSYLLPLRIGHARAFEMFALGDPVPADTAVAWGIANTGARRKPARGSTPRRREDRDQAVGVPDSDETADARRRTAGRADGY